MDKGWKRKDGRMGGWEGREEGMGGYIREGREGRMEQGEERWEDGRMNKRGERGEDGTGREKMGGWEGVPISIVPVSHSIILQHNNTLM